MVLQVSELRKTKTHLKNKIDARELVQLATKILGGKGGGGRPDLASGGGPNGDKAQEALDAIEARIKEIMSEDDVH